MAECHPVGLPVGDGGQGARREGHPRRPAVHPHQRAGRHARAAAGRQRHRASSAASSTTSSSNELYFREYVVAYTNARDDRERGLPGHRGPRRAVLRLRPGDAHATTRRSLAVRRARERARRRRRRPGPRSERRDRPSAACSTRRTAPAPRTSAPAQRDETLQHPRCVFQILKRHYARYTPEMVRAGLRRPAGDVPRGVRGRRPRTPAASGPPRCVYAVGWTQHTRRRAVHPHRARSSSCCWATWAARAAASWRCAGTPASRARPTSRRCSTCCPATCRCRTARRARHAWTTRSTASASPDQKGFWAQRRRLRGQPAQGVLGRRGHRGERLLLRLPAPADRRPRHLPDRAGHDRRQGQGLLPARPEPGGRLGARPDAAARHGQPGLAGRPRPVHDRERHVLEGRARRSRPARSCTEESGTEVFFLPAASHVEKEGTFTQTQRLLQWRDKAVEPPGDARSELWFFYHLGRRIRERLAGSTDAARPAAARPRPGTTRRTASTASRAPRRCCRRSTGTTSATGRPLSTLHRDEGRRLHRRRLLDLHRRLRRRRQPGRPAQARHGAVLGGARVGLGLAGEPAHPLQPRLRRPGRQAVERAQGATSGGTRSRASGPATTCPDFE